MNALIGFIAGAFLFGFGYILHHDPEVFCSVDRICLNGQVFVLLPLGGSRLELDSFGNDRHCGVTYMPTAPVIDGPPDDLIDGKDANDL